MENRRYVLDANVFLEYIFDRKLRDVANGPIFRAIVEKSELIVPSLALDEISEVLYGNLNDIEKVAMHLSYLEKLIYEGVLTVVIPTTKDNCNHTANGEHIKVALLSLPYSLKQTPAC